MRRRNVWKIKKGGMSCKHIWTELRGKRKERRLNKMKDEKGRIIEGEDEVLEVMARHWEELCRGCEDDTVTDTEMGDVGGCELVRDGVVGKKRWRS